MKSPLFCRLLLTVCIANLFLASNATDPKPSAEYYQIRVYHFANADQEKILDDYLSTSYLPALHKAGIKQVGVFKSLANDTVADKRIFVFFSASSLDKLTGLTEKFFKDSSYTQSSKTYLQAAWNQPPFARMENIILKAFRLHPLMKLPALKNANKKERIYELRSYEGPSELLFNSKVHMFNEGGEVSLFQRLNFNAVFYGEVLSGSRMPNLMYMTSFENRADRDAHWKTFVADPEWKRISALPEYQHNVSKSDIMLLAGTDYSDF